MSFRRVLEANKRSFLNCGRLKVIVKFLVGISNQEEKVHFYKQVGNVRRLIRYKEIYLPAFTVHFFFRESKLAKSFRYT